MHTVHGKQDFSIDTAGFAARRAEYTEVLLDIGTGDGRFVCHHAARQPHCLVVGIDACRENMLRASRRAPRNTLFVVANAYSLPHELAQSASHLTINFPWGDLLSGLISGAPALLAGIRNLAGPGTILELCLNGDAFGEHGLTIEHGMQYLYASLEQCGFHGESTLLLDAQALRQYPTTWAHRLAAGRDPRALYLRAAQILSTPSEKRPDYTRPYRVMATSQVQHHTNIDMPVT